MTVDETLRGAAADLRTDVGSSVDAEAALDRVVADRRRRPTAPWLAVAAALLVVAGAVGVVAAVVGDDREPVTSGPPEEPSATVDAPPGRWEGIPVTADPSTDLADGDTVRVTAEGIPREGPVELLMCAADALRSGAGLDACETRGDGRTIDASGGRVEGTIDVERTLSFGGRQEAIDCARDGVPCAIGVVSFVPVDLEEDAANHTNELVGLVTVAFAPLEPLEGPTLSVAPAEGLVHGQIVTVSGEGYGGSLRTAELCGGPEGEVMCVEIALARADDDGVPPVVRTAGTGSFTVEIPIWRAFSPEPGYVGVPPLVDCVEVACTLQVRGEDDRAAPPVALGFDTTVAAPVAPTLGASPTTGIRPGDPITVTVTGLAPGQEAYLMACSGGAACTASMSLETLVGGDDGEVTTTVSAVDPAQYGVDCTQPGSCALALQGLQGATSDPMIDAAVPVPVEYAP